MTVSHLALNSGNHTFTTVLGTNTFTMQILYREAPLGGWYLDMINTVTGVSLWGLPIISGEDILAQFQHLKWGHLRFEFSPGVSEVPTFEDMGDGITMIWSDDDS